jgi:hypothetical protein
MNRALASICLCLLIFACAKSEIGGPTGGGKSGNGGDMGASGQGAGGGNGSAGGTGGQEISGTGGALPDSTSCSQRTVDDCAANAACAVITGQPVSMMSSPACIGPAQNIGCGSNVGCMMIPVRATDQKDLDWVFPSTCIPAGWTDNSGHGTHFDPCPLGQGDGSADGGGQ